MFVLAFTGFGVLAWSLWKLEWMTTDLAAVGGIAAVALPAVGVMLGRAIAARRPHADRIAASWAGAAIGAGCLLIGSVGYIWTSMMENL
ncbi:hypothetical protein SAMN05421869_111152 [Nonomuraea jiangxiensis]|uniref:Uncharacterized protein n=2 Tax=Nonomuraea jiangxiensis TaxID=633440 RepID=A0A1G8V0H6_9ACTN|nr:hypothetical protein SAMN05421869_111152 [Nonomuraea jiangxiensis]